MSASPLAKAHGALVAPISFATRFDLVSALAAQEDQAQLLRVCSAALGVCWSRLSRRLPYDGRVLAYGGRVLDVLMAEGEAAGVPKRDLLAEIGQLGTEALRLCSEGLLDAEVLEAARGNSDAGAGASPAGPQGDHATGG